MEEQKGFCPECEIRALQSAITPEKIRMIVSQMAFVDGVTTPDPLYVKRVAVCSKCPCLKAEILCSECGSYVAYRAKILRATCPFPGTDKWKF